GAAAYVRRQGPAGPSPDALQCPDLIFANHPFPLLRLHETAGQKRRQTEVAVLALEPPVILLDDTAALRTRGLEIAEIARHFVAWKRLGPVHDAPGHLGDFLHDLGTREPAVLHLLD